MKRILAIIGVFFCLLTAVQAEPPGETLRLASVDNIPPYVYRDQGKLTGLAVDIVNELAQRGGFEVVIETGPWARVLYEVEQGLVDGAFSAYMTDARKVYCLYTGIIHYDDLRLAVKKGNGFSFNGIKSLYGKDIGKGRKVFVSKEFDRAVSRGKIFLFETDDMKMINIKKLHEGRLDAVIGSPVAMLHYANELGYKDIELLPGSLKEAVPAYLVLSRNSGLAHKRQWQRMLTDILAGMHEDGTIKDIYKRYGVSGG